MVKNGLNSVYVVVEWPPSQIFDLQGGWGNWPKKSVKIDKEIHNGKYLPM